MASSSKRNTKAAKGSGTVKERVGAHRDRLRAQGLRPIQIWIPDTRARGFAAKVARQCHLIANSPHDAEEQAFIDAISEIKL